MMGSVDLADGAARAWALEATPQGLQGDTVLWKVPVPGRPQILYRNRLQELVRGGVPDFWGCFVEPVLSTGVCVCPRGFRTCVLECYGYGYGLFVCEAHSGLIVV